MYKLLILVQMIRRFAFLEFMSLINLHYKSNSSNIVIFNIVVDTELDFRILKKTGLLIRYIYLIITYYYHYNNIFLRFLPPPTFIITYINNIIFLFFFW